ncbi:DUF21 domain-containing protein [Quillaja saponaria]|uniref:DUF21 domain-containing protein n=1 Tax=Quillaja saponaria TaxID=32244 RepID=A0AAD7M4L1_QUISA|nr:DUF21 domain-containing protein [Quillaja saponaria]
MQESEVPCCGNINFWVFLIMSFVLVSLAGITSGLALGLLSFSQVDLEVLVKSGRPRDSKNAAKILPIVKNEHLLLCTLLIAKSLALEALPLFMHDILPTWAAILMSVALVVAFAEIIPQAVCSRFGLTIGAKLSLFVQLLLLVFFPISYPVSKLLDWLLGRGRSVLLRRSELKTFVDLHGNQAGKGGELSHHETTIITGAMDLTQKTAKDAMTPISETFTLNINSKLDMQTMTLITSKGHSRIPIYSGSCVNIIGLILVKDLMFCRPEDETPIKSMTIRRIPRVYENRPLYDILNQFQKGHSHMVVVLKSNKEIDNAAPYTAGKPTILNSSSNTSLNLGLATNEGSNSFFGQKEHQSTSTYESPSSSCEMEFHSPTLKSLMQMDSDLAPHHRYFEQETGYMSHEEIESLPIVSEEEVTGIITMEDVMEELLQEDILDETDEYVNVRKNIKINLLPSQRLSGSSRKGSFSSISIH